MIVAGIDASTVATGWATIDGAGHQHAEVITPPDVALPGDRATWLRNVSTRNTLTHRIVNTRPWLVLIEGGSAPMSGRGGVWRDRLHGAIGAMLTAQVCRFVEVHPTALKAYACHGRAEKVEMMAAAIDGGAPEICGTDDDAADAWWLARLGSDALDLEHGLPEVTGTTSHMRIGSNGTSRPEQVRELIGKLWGLPT